MDIENFNILEVVSNMAIIKEFNFKSISDFGEGKEEITFIAKGYLDEENNVIYFKNDNNSYKFIFKDDIEVYFNESKYIFDLNKKTLAYVNNDNFTFTPSVFTKKIDISTNKLLVEYEMDFNSFKGEYLISLEWN